MATRLKGLFIDDERFPQDVTWIQYPENVEWTIVRSFQDFNLELAHGDNDYQIYSFDHDIQSYINGREYTGYDCLKCLLNIETMVGNKLDNTQFFFHSQNVVGKKNMESYYQNYVKFMKNAG